MEPKKLERKVIQEKMKGYDSKRKKKKNKKHEDDTPSTDKVGEQQAGRERQAKGQEGRQRGRTSRVQGQGGMEEQGKKGWGGRGGEKNDVEGSGPGVRGLVYQM